MFAAGDGVTGQVFGMFDGLFRPAKSLQLPDFRQAFSILQSARFGSENGGKIRTSTKVETFSLPPSKPLA
jgi:hypothetical protein